jgi:hypothetical protein
MSRAAIATMPKNNFLILSCIKIKHWQGLATEKRFAVLNRPCRPREVQCAATEHSVHTSRMSIAVRRASLFLDLFCTFASNACRGKNKSEAKEI